MNKVKRITKYVIDFFADMSKDNAPAFAASAAFFFFMSIIPIAMFLFALLPYIPFTESDIIRMIKHLLPELVVPTIVNDINAIYAASSKALPVTAIITLWAGALGMMGLTRGLNGVLHIEDKRNYFVVRLIASFYTLVMLAMIIILVVVSILGESIARYAVYLYPSLKPLFRFVLNFSNLFMVIFISLLIALMYTFLPAKRQNFLFVLPGAFIAGAGWILASYGVKLYIELFNGFSIYGSLTTIMVILFWLNLLFNIVMFGAYLNKRFKPYFKVAYEQQQRIKNLKSSSIDNIDNK